MSRVSNAVMAMALGAGLWAAPVRADVFNVADGDVAGLIAAINASNNNSVADSINLANKGVYSLTAVADAGAGPTGLPGIRSMITINGNGSVIERGAGAPASLRIFRVQSAGKLTLNDLEVRNGVAASNSTGSLGGAVHLAGGTLTLTNCTFTNNSAVVGGAIYQTGGTVTLTNSTISGNSAAQAGGIFSDGILNLTSVTLTGNTASDRCGGIDASGVNNTKKVTLANCLVAGNSAPTSPDVGVVSTVTSAGFNLVGDAGTSAGWAASDQVGDASAPIDPLLGPLQLTTGLTPTHELLPGSPAVDAIVVDANGCGTTLTTDQAGNSRPVGSGCDIGSFELQLTPPEAVCQNVTATAGDDCTAAVAPGDVDNGSSVDANCGPATLSLDPPGPYAVGDTVVTLTVTDACDQTATCTATITVVANSEPTCPDDMTLRPTMPSGAMVEFAAAAGDDCGEAGAPACTVESGSVLPMGSTTQVECATEGGETCSFSVYVQTLPEAVTSLLEDVKAMEEASVLRHHMAKTLIGKLKDARHKFKKGKLNAGCGKMTAFANQVSAYVNASKLSAENAEPLLTAADEIINAACGSDPEPTGGNENGNGGGDDDDDDGGGDDKGEGGDDEDDNGPGNSNGGGQKGGEVNVDCGATGATVMLLPLTLLACGRARRRSMRR